MLGYKDTEGVYKPFHLEEELGPDNCIHGEKGCTSCTRACPRFRTWETEIDNFMFGRPRTIDEIDGISKDIILARASDDMVHKMGQDGGVVSAMLIWCLEKGYIDAALVSYLEGDGSTWKAIPGCRTHQGRGARRRRQPLHVLARHRWPTPRPSPAARRSSRSSA